MVGLINAQGQWVSGPDRFWNRDHEIATFIEALDQGDSIHLSAQRRIGKTSLMYEVARRIASRYECVHVDLQSCKGPEDFIAALSARTKDRQRLWSRVRSVFGSFLGQATNAVDELGIDEVTIKIREGLVGANWQVKGDRLIAALAEADQPVVLFLDEVPVMVIRLLRGDDNRVTPERIARTEAFLSWLRRNALEHEAVRFVVTGSIGFEPILREAKLSATINHLRPFPLDPWDTANAIGCWQALAARYRVTFEAGVPERMAEKLGACVPHHVQMFFAVAREVMQKRGSQTCTLDDVETAYTTRMLSTRSAVELSTFEERLKYVVDDEHRPFVLDLITEAAVEGHLSRAAIDVFRREHGLDGRPHDDLVLKVLDVLDHDGYLRRDGERYVFVSNLLRDWWRGRYGTFFTSASER